MRPIWVVVAFLGCAPAAPGPAVEDTLQAPRRQLADDDTFRPSYGKAELQRALIAERGAEATNERVVRDLEAGDDHDKLITAQADLAVRRRFIASLESCEVSGRACPPRLDAPTWTFDISADGAQPPLDAPLRFDLASWQKLTSELHGRACACRTIACVDSVGVAIEQLEPRPMPEVQGDEQATQSITWARECLFRLRGKKPTPVQAPLVDG